MAAAAKGLTIRGLSKRFGSNSVLRDVCLDAPEGRITGLLGPNGAGKTTLFRILMGLMRPDMGTARLNGVDLLDLPLHEKAKAGLGYLPQESASFPELSVRQNLLAVLELHIRDRRERLRRADRLLEQTGLAPIADRRSSALSGGEQRRIEIAKALVMEPRVLLLDEPFAGLDPRITEELLEVIRAMAARGVGLLITDHNVHSALCVADHAYILADGHAAYEGQPDELIANASVRQSYLGSTFGDPL